MSNLIDTVIIFRILKKLTTPWEKTAAFKTGLIDNKGKILVKKADRTPEQNKAYTLLDRLVFNLKRMLSKVPGGGGTLGSYIAALALIKEYVEKESNTDTARVLIEKFEDHGYAPKGISKHDLSTPEGFMDAFEEEFMREMNSGAAIGGRFDGAQSNTSANASGMAAPNSPTKKNRKNRLEKIIHNRL